MTGYESRVDYAQRRRTEFMTMMKAIATDGVRVYVRKADDAHSAPYGYVILPEKMCYIDGQLKEHGGTVILYIQTDENRFGQYGIYFQYQPSKETGTGCEVFHVDKVTPGILNTAAYEGLMLAMKYKATLWSDEATWLGKYWDADGLELLNQ